MNSRPLYIGKESEDSPRAAIDVDALLRQEEYGVPVVAGDT